MRALVDSGHAQLWVVLERHEPIAAVATQITLIPHRRCRLWLVGGNGMDSWAGELLAAVEPWARSIGCTWLWGQGPPGLGANRGDHEWRGD